MKRREPSSEQAGQVDKVGQAGHAGPVGPVDKGLRAQLSRAVRFVLPKGRKSVVVSKQRLSDVLWNDRTMLATAELSARAATQEAEERALEHEAVLLEPESGVSKALPPAVPGRAAPPPAAAPARSTPPPLPGAAALAQAVAVANGAPRERVDTPRQSEAMRARLEATKARVAAKVPAMPKGIAPLAAAQAPNRDDTPKFVYLDVNDGLASLKPAPVAAPPSAAAGSKPPPPAPPPLPVARPRAAPPPADEDDDDAEPICTRSMARLLAGQGHRDRALRIYDTLLAADDSDESLRAEADALRRRAG